MNKERIDPEIAKIQEGAIRAWVSNGDALICSRCQRAYVPSETSDSELCASCVPLRFLRVGDRSPQYPRCEVCGEELRGKRSDVRYCGPSCKKQSYRIRKRGNAETAQDDDATEDLRDDIGNGRRGGHTAREGASTTVRNEGIEDE